MEWTSVVRGSLARPWPRLPPKPEHSIQCGTRQLTKLERSVMFGTRQLTRSLTRQFTRQFSGPGCMQARPKLDSLGEGGEERCGLDLLHEARAVEGFAYRALMGGERHEAVQGDQRRSAEVSRGDPRHTRRSEAIRGSQQRRSETLRGTPRFRHQRFRHQRFRHQRFRHQRFRHPRRSEAHTLQLEKSRRTRLSLSSLCRS